MHRKYKTLRPQSMLIVSISLVFLSSGCSANRVEDITATNKEVVSVKNKPKPIPMSEMKRLTKKEQTLWARQDLASRLKLKLDDVALSGAILVRWRSSALGCPQPGIQYTQALVSGVLIMLRVGNTAYRYHGIPSGEPFYCSDDRAEPPYVNSGDA